MKANLHQFLPVDVLTEVFEILAAKGQSRLVGGCVREMVLGHPPKDIDIATQALPEDAIQLLKKHGYHCIPTGIKYGTITAVKGPYKFEITTLRSDIRTYGRHAEVDFTRDWKLDAERRDFTFNALYMDLEGNIEDFFGGISDLDAKLLRFIGDPKARIREDYLRILRYFRFYSYYNGDNIDQNSVEACAELADGLASLSGERVRTEILKILAAPYAKQSLVLMQKHAVLQQIIPDTHTINFDPYSFCRDAAINLAAIFKLSNLSKPQIEACMGRLTLSNSEKYVITNLLWRMQLDDTDIELKHKAIIYYSGPILYKAYLEFFKVINPNKTISSIKDLNLPEFPVTGTDLLKLGLAGKEIGSTLLQLEEIWINSDFKLNKAELLGEL